MPGQERLQLAMKVGLLDAAAERIRKAERDECVRVGAAAFGSAARFSQQMEAGGRR
jgi:hypothetical protein